MKKLVIVLVLLSLINVRADTNLLQNGDFSDGIAHWEGDCHSPDSDSVDLSAASAPPTTGIVVKLRHSDWTKVTQDFDGNIGEYLLTLNYSFSPGLKFSTNPDDYQNVPAKEGFSLFRSFDSDPGSWVIILSDLGAARFSYWKIAPNMTAGAQRALATVHLDSDDTHKKGFCLLFPPGDGIITLQSISLISKNAAASP
jgi:hypothetical protein